MEHPGQGVHNGWGGAGDRAAAPRLDAESALTPAGREPQPHSEGTGIAAAVHEKIVSGNVAGVRAA
jgi:hypothetical protein